MLVQDLMSRGPSFITADAPLRDAAERMSAKNAGLLAVREGGRIAGVVTDRDLALRPVEGSLSYDSARVRDIMTPEAHAVRSTTSVSKAAEAMKEKSLQRLLVLDGNAQLVGVLSVSDLAAERTVQGLACDVIGHLAKERVPSETSHGGS